MVRLSEGQDAPVGVEEPRSHSRSKPPINSHIREPLNAHQTSKDAWQSGDDVNFTGDRLCVAATTGIEYVRSAVPSPLSSRNLRAPNREEMVDRGDDKDGHLNVIPGDNLTSRCESIAI